MPDEQPTQSALVSPQSAESVPAWQYVEGGFQCVLPRGAFAPQLVITEFDAHEFASTPPNSRTGTYVTEITIEFNVSSDTPLSNTDIAVYLPVDDGDTDIPAIDGIPFASVFNNKFAPDLPFMQGMTGTFIVTPTEGLYKDQPNDKYVDDTFYQRAFWGGKSDPSLGYSSAFINSHQSRKFSVFRDGTESVEFYPNFTWLINGAANVGTVWHPILGSWNTDFSDGKWVPSISTVMEGSTTTPPPLKFPLPYEFPEATLYDETIKAYVIFEDWKFPAYAELGEIETNLTYGSPDRQADPRTSWTLTLQMSDTYDAGFIINASWPDLGQTYAHYFINNEEFDPQTPWQSAALIALANRDPISLPLWGDNNAPLSYYSVANGTDKNTHLNRDLFCVERGVNAPYRFSKTITPQYARWDVNTFWRDSNLADFKLVIAIMPLGNRPAAAIITVSGVKLTVKTTTTTEDIAQAPTAQPDTIDIQQVLTFSSRNLQRALDPPPLDIAEGGLVSMDDGAWLLTTINSTKPANTVTYADDVAVGGSTTVAPSNPWNITYQDIESNIVDPETGQPLQLNVVSTCKTSLQGGIITAQLLRVSDFPTAVPENAIIQKMTLSFDADAKGNLVEHYIALYLTPPGEPVVVSHSIDNGTQQAWNGNTRTIFGPPNTFLSPEIYAVYGQLLKTQQWGIIICTAFHTLGVYPDVANSANIYKEVPITISNISMTFEWTLPPPPPPFGGAAALPAPTILSIPSNLRARPQTKNASSSTAQSVSAGLLPTEGIIIGVPGDFRSHTLNKKK